MKKELNITNLFSLHYYDYDESCTYLLYHDKKTPKQFDADVEFIIKKYAGDVLAQKEYFAGVNDLVKVIYKRLPELGYQYASYHGYAMSGPCIIYRADDVADIPCFPKDVLKKVIEMNDDINDRLNNRQS